MSLIQYPRVHFSLLSLFIYYIFSNNERPGSHYLQLISYLFEPTIMN